MWKNRIKRVISFCYIVGFMLMITVPLLLTNRDGEAISEKELRPLAKRPPLMVDGKFNEKLFSRIDDYFDDRIGFRDELIILNARLQFYMFGRLENPEKYRLGPNGEANIIERDVVQTFQHKNLMSNEELDNIAESFTKINNYLESRNCKYFYVTCYDKESIYPEYFPNSVNQYGDVSRTDQFIDRLKAKSDVNVIDIKPAFLNLRDEYELYAPKGDPVHWTPRGGYLGYKEIMKAFNAVCGEDYYVLSEDDFDINITDQGWYFYGGLKLENYSEDFVLKEPKAKLVNNVSYYYDLPYTENIYLYRNENAGNDSRLLIMGNSYTVGYILPYFAESFGEVLWLHRSDCKDYFRECIECYNPDILLSQTAERYISYSEMIRVADGLP